MRDNHQVDGSGLSSMSQRRPSSASPTAGAAHTCAYRPNPLASILKQETQAAHRRAETSGVIRRLVRQQASRAIYIAYLRNLHPVYQMLEQRLAELGREPPFDVIAHPALYRRTALERDLSALAGNGWRDSIAMLPATRAYITRLATADEAQLAAHSYVRYLGDINGGTIIKRLLRKSLALDETELAFYEFDDISDPAAFCDDFKAALDTLSKYHDTRRIVDEALVGFRLATDQSIEIEKVFATGA